MFYERGTKKNFAVGQNNESLALSSFFVSFNGAGGTHLWAKKETKYLQKIWNSNQMSPLRAHQITEKKNGEL